MMQCALYTSPALVITYVDLTKAFDTIPKQLVSDTLIKTCPTNNLISRLAKILDNPKRYGGVSQRIKEEPTLYNLVFQHILSQTINKTTR